MIVICGRTCAGKDTLGRWLEERHGFEKVISYTTRPPREGEVDNKDYYFVTGAMFNTMCSNGDFAETTDYKQENGDIWSYGTHVNSYKDSKKKKYVILNPEGIYQLVNRDIHFDLFYLDNKNKEALEKRYRGREYVDTHFQPWIDKKFETRWRQDEKDFNAFDEWLKKAKTEEGLPIQIDSVTKLSTNHLQTLKSHFTMTLRKLGYIESFGNPKKDFIYTKFENDELEEKLNEKDKEYEELKYKYDILHERHVSLLKDHDAISCSRKHLHEMLSKEIEDRHELEEKYKALEWDFEEYKKSYNELYENYSNNPDKSVIKELEHKLKQAEMLRDYYKGLKEEVVEIDRELHKEYDKLADKYLSHKNRNATAYYVLKDNYNESLSAYSKLKEKYRVLNLKYDNECDINRTRIAYLEDELNKYQKKCEDLKERLMQAHGIIDKHREQYKQQDEIAFENKKLKEENDILKKQDDQLLMVLALTVSYLENKEDPKNER